MLSLKVQVPEILPNVFPQKKTKDFFRSGKKKETLLSSVSVEVLDPPKKVSTDYTVKQKKLISKDVGSISADGPDLFLIFRFFFFPLQFLPYRFFFSPGNVLVVENVSAHNKNHFGEQQNIKELSGDPTRGKKNVNPGTPYCIPFTILMK